MAIPLLALPFVVLAACQSIAPGPATSTEQQNTARAGQIWDARTERLITPDELLQKAFEARFVLLGEIHDNLEHHRLQNDVLKALLAKGARPTLAMEQLDSEQQAAIDQAAAAPGATGETIADAGRFDRKAWGWIGYGPLISTAVQAGLPIAALNLSRGEARQVASGGFNTLGAGRAGKLALEATWNAERDASLRREIADAHCGQLPDSVLPGMVMAQRARDAVMADVLLGQTTSSVVAILGRGHARNDVGVPRYLAERAPAAKVVSIGLVEVDPRRYNALDYLTTNTEGRHFDYVWFTPRAERDDPCAGFKLPAPR